jgi:DNA-directed RNA polymerase subunit RPC12/RpoP
MESVKAIATLLSSSNVEGLKKFRESVDMLINIVTRSGSPSASDIEDARSVLLERLMKENMTLALICSNCGTHFIEVKDVIEEPMYSHICCPRCSLTLSLRLDAELLKTLSGATGGTVKLVLPPLLLP